MVGKQVVFDDGLFEVTLIKDAEKSHRPAGDHRGPSDRTGRYEAYVYLQDRQGSSSSPWKEISWTLDGEYGGSHDKVVIENLNKQLQIMVPEEHIRELMANPDDYQPEESGAEEDL